MPARAMHLNFRIYPDSEGFTVLQFIGIGFSSSSRHLLFSDETPSFFEMKPLPVAQGNDTCKIIDRFDPQVITVDLEIVLRL